AVGLLDRREVGRRALHLLGGLRLGGGGHGLPLVGSPPVGGGVVVAGSDLRTGWDSSAPRVPGWQGGGADHTGGGRWTDDEHRRALGARRRDVRDGDGVPRAAEGRRLRRRRGGRPDLL